MSQPTSPTGRPRPPPRRLPLDVPVTLTVELGRVNLTLSRLADLKPGDVVELSRQSRAGGTDLQWPPRRPRRTDPHRHRPRGAGDERVPLTRMGQALGISPAECAAS